VKGEQLNSNIEDLKNLLKSQDMNTQSKLCDINKVLNENIHMRMNLTERRIGSNINQMKELSSRFKYLYYIL